MGSRTRRALDRPASAVRHRYDRAVRVFPVGGFFLRLGQASLGFLAVLVALGLATIPSGSARVLGIVAAVVVVAGAAYLIRSMHRQAIMVDGDRLGWRRGLTSKIVGWTDLADVEGATRARLSTTVTKDRKVDTILWTASRRAPGLQRRPAPPAAAGRPATATRRRRRKQRAAAPVHRAVLGAVRRRPHGDRRSARGARSAPELTGSPSHPSGNSSA